MELNAELVSGIVALVSAIVVAVLKHYGKAQAVAIIEDVSPHIVATLNKALADGKLTKQDAKAAALDAADAAVKQLAPVASHAMLKKSIAAIADTAIEDAVTASKIERGAEVAVSAFTDGKKLGAEIAAKMKRGEIGANVETSGRGNTRAGLFGKFRIGR